MNKIEPIYDLSDIKPGDFVIVGNGKHAVGWNSVIDHDYDRRVDWRVWEVKRVTEKSVIPVQTYGRDRFEIDQILGVFDTRERAERVAAEARQEWEAHRAEIDAAQAELRRLQEQRFRISRNVIRKMTNR